MLNLNHDGLSLRGEFDDDRVMWFPAEDITKIRGMKKIETWELNRAGLRDAIDYQVVDARSELARNLRVNYRTGNPRRLLISESGLYMLMMKGQGKRDRLLQYWLADEVIPAIRRHGEYELPAEHPVYAVLQETSDMLKVYRDLTWELAEHSDLTLGDLVDQHHIIFDISDPKIDYVIRQDGKRMTMDEEEELDEKVNRARTAYRTQVRQWMAHKAAQIQAERAA
jgi:prophage antirepressor-like protein